MNSVTATPRVPWLDPSEKQASRSLQTLVTWLPMHLDSQLRQDAGLGLATPCRARDVCGSLFDHLPAEQAGALGQAAQLIVDAMVPRRRPGSPGRRVDAAHQTTHQMEA